MPYTYNPLLDAGLDQTGSGGSATTPGGSNTQIQFNDSGSFGGDADLTYNKTTNALTIGGDVTLNDGGSFTTTLQTITPTANRTLSLPDATGTVALVAGSSGQLIYNSSGANAGASTLTYDGSILTTSGRFINSYNATASSPAKAFTGTWFTGGTATTTKPQVLIEPTGTTSTAWSTSGTGLGVNAASSFAGNLLDLQVNGSRRLGFNSATNTLTFSDTLASGINFRSFSLVASLYNRTVLSCNENGALSWPYGIGEVGTVTLNSAYDINYSFNRITFSLASNTAATTQLQAVSSGTLRLDNRSGGAGGFQIVNTYTSSTNYELGKLEWSSNVFRIGTEKGSGGGTARTVEVHTDSVARLALDTTGSVRVVTGLTVATLPGTPAVGMVARVTDATAPAVGSTVAGGGAAAALVWYNGTNWTVIGV